MTSTEHLQKKPDFYGSVDECVASGRKHVQSNPRYKGYDQTNFTAGDEQQFQQYRDASNGNVCMRVIELTNNVFADANVQVDWVKYQHLTPLSVDNTFHYMFHKLKKGIFVKIKQGKLAVFLPFSKSNFTNEWGDRIQAAPSLIEFLKRINRMENEGRKRKYHFAANRVNKFPQTWYANNCFVRLEWPIAEGDTNVPNMKNMLETLCAQRDVPDMEFFINRRDFPVLKRDGTEPYNNIFDSDEFPLLSHAYDTYSPVLSMVTTDQFADIPMPTGEDWARVSAAKGKYFDRNCTRVNDDKFDTPWEDRVATAVFRGGSTGCGVTPETNTRLKLAQMSANNERDSDDLLFLDAGITNWNLRTRKIQGEKYLQTIEIDKVGVQLVPKLTPSEQSKFKYIINVDGHVSAFRLSLEMNMGACLLLVDSPYRMWFRKSIVPYVHYVPVKADMSDLISQIKWCKSHDDECKQIADNARKFYQTHLSEDGCLDYMQSLLVKLKQRTGVYLYNSMTPTNMMMLKKHNILMPYRSMYPRTEEAAKFGGYPAISPMARQARSHGLLQGLRWVINMITKGGVYPDNFNDEITVRKYLVQKEHTYVKLATLADYPLTIKYAQGPDIMNEIFVGLTSINKVVQHIPNFTYVFGAGVDSKNRITVISEYIVGETLSEYISSDAFNMPDFILILLQVALALKVAQNTCGFVHYDLTPWNIVITKLKRPINVDYVIGANDYRRVVTHLIPVIIDYGKSHVIYGDETNKRHFGMVNPFKMSTIQDMLSILVTSLSKVMRNMLSPQSQETALSLANFVTGTTYQREAFKSIHDLKVFLTHATKYDALVNSPKYELEALSPVDFIDYVSQRWDAMAPKVSAAHPARVFPVRRVDTFSSLMNTGNARQVFDYILATNQKERIESFTNVFVRLSHSSLPQPSNLFMAYAAAQTIHTNLVSVKNNMVRFMKQHNIPQSKYLKMFDISESQVKKVYDNLFTILNPSLVEFEHEIAPSVSLSEDLFLLPDEVLRLREDTEDVDISDVTDSKNMVQYVLGTRDDYALPKNVRSYYTDTFAPLMGVSNFDTADVNSLRDMSRRLYSSNLRTMSPEKYDGENCDDFKRYQKTYKKILSLDAES
mgnify:CR=1 FL=1|jgi:hypothetical protein